MGLRGRRDLDDDDATAKKPTPPATAVPTPPPAVAAVPPLVPVVPSVTSMPALVPELPSTENATLETVATWVHELPVASLDQSQYLSYASACYLATLHQCRLRNPLAGIDNLHAALRRIDTGLGLSDWFVRLPANATPGDDDQDILHAVLPTGVTTDDPARLDRIAAVAWIALAIGRALSADGEGRGGDKRHGLHYHVAATYVFTALRRRRSRSSTISSSSNRRDSGASVALRRQYIAESQFRELYMYSTRLALALMPDTGDLAVELATKLVSIHDVAIAEAVGAAAATPPAAGDSREDRLRSSGSEVFSSPSTLVDPDAHFAAQVALGGALLATNALKPAYRAYSRALELLHVEWPFRESGKKIQPASSLLVKLLVNLTTCGMAIQRPPDESLIHARAAMQAARQMDAAGGTTATAAAGGEINTLLRAIGTLAYRYALDLAGGPDTASSPPVAIVHPGVETKLPAARDLVCEASVAMQEALNGQKGKRGARALALQLAILKIELREETLAHDLLSENDLDRGLITELDAYRRTRSASAGSSDSSSPPSARLVPFIDTIYSQSVLKSLLAIAPNPPPPEHCTTSATHSSSASIHTSTPSSPSSSSSGSPAPSSSSSPRPRPRMVLSRKSRANLRTECTYCCMTSVSEPTRCEVCAASNIFVWYCGEECFYAHAIAHARVCVAAGKSSWSDSPFFGARF
ncbi:hypothetical protein HDU87_002018 [Geranomyces variabilis]|uniref:Uncharacterized protein n=1 Tax=Geranomyces variabilis TaxID=109894 RepID=A0AAD5TLX8_9FUNG|nr:hypothetical protein HDU87_002018 [Geranomyces variabilis]